MKKMINGSYVDLTPSELAEYQSRLDAWEASAQSRSFKILRDERNNLLAQTDWRMTTDYRHDDKPLWEQYRQALRDLPANSSPALDEFGNLINVEWPEEPA